MTHHVLVAVDDSPDALAAARWAVSHAAEVGATLRVLHVASPQDDPDGPSASPGATAHGWDSRTAPVLARVAGLATIQGVTVVTDLLVGGVEETILSVATDWPADLLVLGRSGRPPGGWGYVGTRTRHVLELSTKPVVVVPGPRAAH